jgi:hypothetical protein
MKISMRRRGNGGKFLSLLLPLFFPLSLSLSLSFILEEMGVMLLLFLIHIRTHACNKLSSSRLISLSLFSLFLCFLAFSHSPSEVVIKIYSHIWGVYNRRKIKNCLLPKSFSVLRCLSHKGKRGNEKRKFFRFVLPFHVCTQISYSPASLSTFEFQPQNFEIYTIICDQLDAWAFAKRQHTNTRSLSPYFQ